MLKIDFDEIGSRLDLVLPHAFLHRGMAMNGLTRGMCVGVSDICPPSHWIFRWWYETD